ncbi:hypothetical protein SAMN02982989_3352 [Xaviernesmea oryzae]|uniref:Uncharacterized protein n=1 Tax=Xaviernesmea oryzae TaxID=464029 RepID=A0A1X7G900_9HYPH|nr:hypothetical protein SAMN02982989_3352 [Xaviernesmea oryzae]
MVGESPGGEHAVGGTVVEYLEFITTLNPVVIAILAIVLACGAYDYWVQTK